MKTAARYPFLRIAVALSLMAGAISALPCAATVRSEALYARGLIPFNNGRWDEAYRLFNEAVQADPTDAVAVYYRGLTQARRGMSAAAIQDMELALKLNPSLPHVALDLGIAYFDAGDYASAKIWLERAYQQSTERFTAAFFMGMTLYRLEDDAGAQKYLTEAKADPELRGAAGYYLGLSLQRQGQMQAAQSELAEVAREQPETEVGKAAQHYAVPEEGRQELEGAAKKPWSVSGGFSLLYDSNVVITPSNSNDLLTAQGISRKDDGAAVLTAAAAYSLYEGAIGSVLAQYDFYQSAHFELSQFDLQGHTLLVAAQSKPATFSYGISGTYDFYLLNYQTFYQEVLGTPWVSLAESSGAATQVYYTIRGQDFFRGPYDPGRDGMDNAVGVRQYLALGSPERVLGMGYQWDAEDTTSNGPMGRDFQYQGNQWDIGVTLPVWQLGQAQLAYLFRLEDYEFPNSRTDFVKRRHDHENEFVVGLLRDITEHVALTTDFIGVLNGSNIHDFSYDRYIVSVGARVVF